MPFWYNKKDEEKVATLSCTNWEEVNSKVTYEELGYMSDDDFYYLIGLTSKFTDCKKRGENDFSLTDEITRVKVARRNYTKKDWNTKKDVQVKQSRVEKWVCKILDSLDADKRYKGFIDLQDGNYLDNLLSEKDSDGKELPSGFLETMSSSYRQLNETPESKITSDLLEVPKYKSFGGYSKGQSEKEKLEDRQAYMLEACKDIKGDDKVPTIAEFFNLIQNMDSAALFALDLADKIC